jgi:hypothetical protein
MQIVEGVIWHLPEYLLQGSTLPAVKRFGSHVKRITLVAIVDVTRLGQ